MTASVNHYICRTCGVQHSESPAPPTNCAICDDERQYIPPQGQQWTTLAQLRSEGHRVQIRDLEEGLAGLGAEPKIGIGQRALLVQTQTGNFLWDCFGFIDDEAISAIRERGGIHGIAMSHPHFYGVCVEWSHAFDGAPIYIPDADRQWVMRPDRTINYWQGRTEPIPGLTLIQTGGHFEGSTVLHWPGGAGGRGALLTGDSIAVVQDRRFVSFMRSYPNDIPLPIRTIRRIAGLVEPLAFDRIYGAFWDGVVAQDAQAAVRRSADRYIRWIQAEADP